jgi:hypothetical protein
MRAEDRLVFVAAAKTLNLWILVRKTNERSLDFIGRAGFTPKPIDCKAKTADVGDVAGLVVDAEIHTTAFRPKKAPEAIEIWRDFKVEHLGYDGYDVDLLEKSPFYGCLMVNGKYIHGDYDLYDIVIPGQEMRNLASHETLRGKTHRRPARYFIVKDFVNQRIGVPMIQHGGEAQYKDHTNQAIDVFAPKQDPFELRDERALREHYATIFKGRKTLPL